MRKLQTHEELLASLKVLSQDGIPNTCNELETYGRRTFAYIQWPDMDARKKGEMWLSIWGYRVNEIYSPGLPLSEVQVSTMAARKVPTFNRQSSYTIRTCSVCGKPITTKIIRQCPKCMKEKRGL